MTPADEPASDNPVDPLSGGTPPPPGSQGGMKAPKYAAVTMQQILNVGINAFAAELLAESHADKPERFGDETVMLMLHAHNGTPVYMLLSTRRPTLDQFKDWPK